MGLLAARPIWLLAQLARPVVWLLDVTPDLVIRLLALTQTDIEKT